MGNVSDVRLNGWSSQKPVKITIKKGQGITQALFDLVKDMEAKGLAKISDNTISDKEWNNTLNKLVELQRDRKANGEENIYTGGSDSKDYLKNFVVQQNQEIEFSAEEMNILYKALGVEVKRTPASNEILTPKETPVIKEELASIKKNTDIEKT